MTFHDGVFAEELFLPDRIHLNRDGQLKWCREYILPAIRELTETYGLDSLRQ